MNLRDYLLSKDVWVEALFWPSYGQSAGSFSGDEDEILEPNRIAIYIHEQYGRFGNNVYQLLHALIVARKLSARSILCTFYLDDLRTSPVMFDDIVVNFGVSEPPKAPQISGAMFYPQGFESFFRHYSFSAVKWDAERLSRALIPDRDRIFRNWDKRVVVFHFRSGDIFEPNAVVNSIYSQPPLSYYKMALDHICETIENFEACLVFENDRNPCIGAFRDILAERNITYIEQSSSLYEDMRLMIAADCIVSSVSSFCEVAALMSENIRRLYAFRSVAVYGDVSPAIYPDLRKTLESSGVEVFVVADVDGQYTPSGGWKFSTEQVHQLLNYPSSSLSLKAGRLEEEERAVTAADETGR